MLTTKIIDRIVLPSVILSIFPLYFIFASNQPMVLFSRQFVHDSSWQKNETLDRLVKHFVNSIKELTPKPEEIEKLKNLANPCWKRSNSGIIDCLPIYYFGGFAKCSTTDVWRRLLLHPQVFNTGKTVSAVNLVPKKEFRFWTKYLFKDAPLSSYTSTFAGVSNHADSIVGDGSVGTFPTASNIHKTAERFLPGSALRRALLNSEILPAHLIVQYVPQAKFLVMVREPTERLYLFYLHMYRTFKYEDRTGWQDPSEATFHQLVLDAIDTFNACRIAKSARDCAYDDTVIRSDQKNRIGLHVGLYVVFIKDAMKLISREHIKVFRSEDYILNKKDVLQNIGQFIGLNNSDGIINKIAPAEMHIFDQKDPTKFSERISPVEKAPMWIETRDILIDFYRPFNEELAELLNDDRHLFKDVSSRT